MTGWLEKNKDPLNDTIVELIKNGGNTLAIECFKDHPGQVISNETHLPFKCLLISFDNFPKLKSQIKNQR